MAEILRA